MKYQKIVNNMEINAYLKKELPIWGDNGISPNKITKTEPYIYAICRSPKIMIKIKKIVVKRLSLWYLMRAEKTNILCGDEEGKVLC